MVLEMELFLLEFCIKSGYFCPKFGLICNQNVDGFSFLYLIYLDFLRFWLMGLNLFMSFGPKAQQLLSVSVHFSATQKKTPCNFASFAICK